MTNRIVYNHDENVHNLKSPEIIVPILIDIIKPQSVIDIGCGIGTFLHVFKKCGIKNILGIDGKWVNHDLLKKYINPNKEFMIHNLGDPLNLNKKFDLVITLEVIEHINQEYEDIFVKNLVNLGDVIVFSAAPTLQGGQNHINEQRMTYWEDKFLKYDFEMLDIIRPIIWNNEDVFPWYRQNMILIKNKNISLNLSELPAVPKSMRNIIHPILFEKAKTHLLTCQKSIFSKIFKKLF